jgi:DNA sulfur modification protein DndD
LSEKGKLPPKIQEWFVGDLLDEGECICGENLDEHPEKRERLEHLQTEVSHVSEENLEGKTEIPRIIDDGDEATEELLRTRQDISNIEDDIDKIQRELQDIAEELKKYDTPDDDVDVSALENQRTELEEQKEELQKKVFQLEADINSKKEEVKEAKKEWKKEAEQQTKYQEMIRKVEFLEDTADDISDIKNKILSQIRKETQERLDEYFNELIWKDEEYDIQVGENYTVSVLGPRGDNKIGSLSAGEKQVLALSFMSALTSISGFSAPIVIDTPLGRISGENKRRIASNLPEYLQGTQITFLMTDQEFDSDVEARLQSSLANEYVLRFEDEMTQIEPKKKGVTSND